MKAISKRRKCPQPNQLFLICHADLSCFVFDVQRQDFAIIAYLLLCFCYVCVTNHLGFNCFNSIIVNQVAFVNLKLTQVNLMDTLLPSNLLDN